MGCTTSPRGGWVLLRGAHTRRSKPSDRPGSPHPWPPQLDSHQTTEHYVDEDDRVLLDDTLSMVCARSGPLKELPSVEPAGPRRQLFFDPAKTRAGIVTCAVCACCSGQAVGAVTAEPAKPILKAQVATERGSAARSVRKVKQSLLTVSRPWTCPPGHQRADPAARRPAERGGCIR